MLFNSYYEAVGPKHSRTERGLITRPGHRGGRGATAATSTRRCSSCSPVTSTRPSPTSSSSGCHHEQQHQELLVMDIKHVLSCNPLRPGVRPAAVAGRHRPASAGWIEHDGGIVEIGHAGDGFAFDNEGPRHEALLRPHRVGDGAGHERRLAGVHRRRRLRPARAVDVRRLGHRPGSRLGGARVLAAIRRRVARVRPRRHRPGRPGRAGRPRQLVRGRRLRPLGRRPPADRGRVGDGGARRRTIPTPAAGTARRGSGRRARTTPTRASSPSAGAVGEYNGKFMVNQQVLRGSARVDAARPRPAHVPQLLPGRRPLGLRRPPPR